ncbi:MAG: ABC transporter ATP-binding protein [Anaerolineales bacterium]|nr:ABC transporter ATP-binding protein [Anaerolineales bacterium]
MIDVSALTVKYTGRKRPVLRELSLQVPKGQTLLILGPSGSGKSSLALTLNGLIPHSIGEVLGGAVRVAGADTQHTPVAQLAQRVGILFQDPDAQFATLTVEDEIVFGLENLCLDPAQMDARVEAALAQVGMAHARRRPVFALSGGEKQRIALAALLAMQPEVLVFDEPTAHLDSVGTQQVFALLAQLKARGEHTLILIEHKLDELMHLVDRVVVLDMDGAVFADGPPRTLFDQHAVELQEMGVWMPQVCLLAQQLRTAGLPLKAFPVTIGEAVKALGPALAAAPPAPAPVPSPVNPGGAAVYSVRDLSFSYGDMPALHNVSLDIQQGDFLAIVGPNGAGKSTLARHLIGLLTPPPGTVLLNEQDVHDLDARRLAQQVAYVFQNPEHQFVTERVDDEVAFGLRAAGMGEEQVAAQTARLLETFGLARYAPANPFTLSHGEKRRLSVAAMLAIGQETLILDEPTFGQDERNAAALMALLRALNAEGKTVVMITHDMRLVAEAADKVAVILGGRLEFFGPPAELFAQGDLLARAHLNLPPLARLAALLATQHPQMAGWATLQDYQPLSEAVRV